MFFKMKQKSCANVAKGPLNNCSFGAPFCESSSGSKILISAPGYTGLNQFCKQYVVVGSVKNQSAEDWFFRSQKR